MKSIKFICKALENTGAVPVAWGINSHEPMAYRLGARTAAIRYAASCDKYYIFVYENDWQHRRYCSFRLADSLRCLVGDSVIRVPEPGAPEQHDSLRIGILISRTGHLHAKAFRNGEFLATVPTGLAIEACQDGKGPLLDWLIDMGHLEG